MADTPLTLKLKATTRLTEEDAAAVTAMCQKVQLISRRKDVISQGEIPDRVHLVVSGWAARYHVLPDGSRQITAFLLPGDFCDLHVTMLSSMDHGIVALTDCKIAYIKQEEIVALTDESPALARAFWRSTLIDEAVLREWIVNAGRRTAEAAVAHLLCELHARLSVVGLVEANRLQLPLTQEELADATAMTPVHMNRVLQKLRGLGAVDLRQGTLEVLDLSKLQDMGGFDPQYLHLRQGG